jgi:hypothetical protein
MYSFDKRNGFTCQLCGAGEGFEFRIFMNQDRFMPDGKCGNEGIHDTGFSAFSRAAVTSAPAWAARAGAGSGPASAYATILILSVLIPLFILNRVSGRDLASAL